MKLTFYYLLCFICLCLLQDINADNQGKCYDVVNYKTKAVTHVCPELTITDSDWSIDITKNVTWFVLETTDSIMFLDYSFKNNKNGVVTVMEGGPTRVCTLNAASFFSNNRCVITSIYDEKGDIEYPNNINSNFNEYPKWTWNDGKMIMTVPKSSRLFFKVSVVNMHEDMTNDYNWTVSGLPPKSVQINTDLAPYKESTATVQKQNYFFQNYKLKWEKEGEYWSVAFLEIRSNCSSDQFDFVSTVAYEYFGAGFPLSDKHLSKAQKKIDGLYYYTYNPTITENQNNCIYGYLTKDELCTFNTISYSIVPKKLVLKEPSSAVVPKRSYAMFSFDYQSLNNITFGMTSKDSKFDLLFSEVPGAEYQTFSDSYVQYISQKKNELITLTVQLIDNPYAKYGYVGVYNTGDKEGTATITASYDGIAPPVRDAIIIIAIITGLGAVATVIGIVFLFKRQNYSKLG